MLNLHRFLCMIGKMKTSLLKVVVVVAVMLVGFTVTATPFANDYVVENANSTLFSNDIDINKYGNHLQKRNIQVKKVDYNYSQRAEQSRRVSIVNGAERVSSMPQVTLQNNTWNGYTRTGVDAVATQNVTYNRPMAIDAYSARTQVTEAFADNDVIEIGNMQKVAEEGTYGDGKEPGKVPATDVVWGFLLCAIGYVCIRRRF